MDGLVKTKACLVIAALVTTSGCALGPTGYHPLCWNGGYENVIVQSGIYRVGFYGNGSTHKSQAKDFALMRAAELTLNEGLPYFETIEQESAVQTSMSNLGENLVTLHRPNCSLMIRCLENKSEGRGFVYDAAQVYENLRLQYGIKNHQPLPLQAHRAVRKSQEPQSLARKPASSGEAQAIAESLLAEVQPPKKTTPFQAVQSLLKSHSKDYAERASAIAKDPAIGDQEKLHALATLSAIHAATAKAQEEKEMYTRLNENFLKRAEALENRPTAETIADHSPGQASDATPSEPEGRQVVYIEDVDK